MIENRRSNIITNQQLEMIHQAIFGKYDLDNNGYLEKEEVEMFMRDALIAGGNTEEQVENAIKKFYHQVDKNGDGKISKEEMIEILKYIL
jgi:Ca2+-binding EF-hand superfamily protein